jgi:hypothetical protein
LATETKQAFRTTEFWVFTILAIAILVAAASNGADENGRDIFRADKAWLFVTVLAAAYLISRGLAKSGSRDPYWDRPDTGGADNPITERVKAAAAVLKDGEGPSGGESERTPQPGAH